MAEEEAATPGAAEAEGTTAYDRAFTLDGTAALISGLQKLTKEKITNEEAVACLSGAADEALRESVDAIASAAVETFADEGGIEPPILACGLGLLCHIAPADKLQLVFRTCDTDNDGIISPHQLGFVLKAFNSISLTLVQNILRGVVGAMGGGEGEQKTMFDEVLPAMNASVASLSRSARELCAPHGVTMSDFQAWSLSQFGISAWVRRLYTVWTPLLLGVPAAAPMPIDRVKAALHTNRHWHEGHLTSDLEHFIYELPAVRIDALRERLLVMTQAMEDKKPCAAVALTLLSDLSDPGERIKAVVDVCAGAAAGRESEIGQPLAEEMAEGVRSLGEEVADGLLASCSLLLTGKPRGGGVPRKSALERLAPGLEALVAELTVESEKPAAVDEEVAAAAGIVPQVQVAALEAKWLSSAAFKQWEVAMLRVWPCLVRTYSRAFNPVLMRRQKAHLKKTDWGSPKKSRGAADEDEAAEVIQRNIRRKEGQKEYKLKLKSAMRVQTLFRVHQAKARAEELRRQRSQAGEWESAQQQRVRRIGMNEQELSDLKLVPASRVENWTANREHGAITTTQACWRARQVRRQLPALHLWRTKQQAATRIQRFVGPWLQRIRQQDEALSGSLAAANFKPRAISSMTADDLQRFQQLIAARRRARPLPESLAALRQKTQKALEDRAKAYSASSVGYNRRQALLQTIPNQLQLMYDSPTLTELQGPILEVPTSFCTHFTARQQGLCAQPHNPLSVFALQELFVKFPPPRAENFDAVRPMGEGDGGGGGGGGSTRHHPRGELMRPS
jgi:hypothetical protein